MGSNISSVWTDEALARLKTMWSEGVSCSAIGKILGCSRNAVVGKVHRIRLSGRLKYAPKEKRAAEPMARTPRPTGLPRSTQPPALRAPRVHPAVPLAPTIAAEPNPDFNDDAIPIEQRRSLMQLTAAVCHWPVGDPGAPGFFFCGAMAEFNQPYCAHHHGVAYQPLQDRHRRPHNYAHG